MKPSNCLSLISAALCLLWAGCGEEAAQLEPAPQVVQALWNPATGMLPTPTDLVRDPSTGRLNLPITEQMPGAEREFRAWLNTLDGYPVTSTITIPVSGPVDVASLGGTVKLVDLDTGAPLDVDATYSAEKGAILVAPRVVQPEHRLQPGRAYMAGLWGYDGGARGASGEPVIADAAFYLVRGREALTDHLSAVPGATRAEREATAQRLEQVRLLYGGLYAQMERLGVAREQLAVVTSFRTTSRPSIWFDSATAQVPLPNDVLRDRHTGLVTLPASASDSPESAHIKQVLSRYEGFSPTAALTMRATAPLDPASVNRADMVQIWRLEPDGTYVEETELERGVLDDPHVFWVEPRISLEAGRDYITVVRRGVKTADGAELIAQPAAALLKLSSPLEVGGRSQVSALDDATAQRLEPVRAKVAPFLEFMEASGTPREDVLMAVPFRTLSAAKYMMTRRARLYEQDVRTDVVDVTARTPRERGLRLLMPSVKTIVTGKVTVLDHLEPRTRRWRNDDRGQERLVDFVLTIPDSAKPGEPLPVVVFGHGLETSRELLYLIAEPLADAGFAAITLDLPYHGERSVCLRSEDCRDGATCNEEGICLNRDGSRGKLKGVASPFPDGPSYPITSGMPFIDLNDIEGSRDHFMQAILDVCQLLRVVRGADWARATGGYVLSGQDVMYLGMSLGGILGSNLTVVEPTIKHYVLNVPGASFLEMLENSDTFSGLFAQALRERGIERGSDGYFQFKNAVRWMIDPVDPINVVLHTFMKPLDYVDPVDGQTKRLETKRVQIQMARGDVVVPNISTRLLAERMGLTIREYDPIVSNHAFLFDPTSQEGRRARRDMIEFFEQRGR
jgi:dienelactone hydrolase